MRPPPINPQLPPSLYLWFSHVDVHNSILEYASTTSILKPLEKKFLKKWFSPQISSKPSSPQEMEHEKKEKKGKLQLSLQIKGEVNILSEDKHFNFKNSFWCNSIFPLHHTISKPPFQNHSESFLNSFWTII
jgi:hypothetical protein